jgi:hypothetical protein
MLVFVLGVALVGSICGLLLLDARGVALLSSVAILAFLLLGNWDWMLLIKIVVTISGLHSGYLAGAALRIWWDGSCGPPSS